MKSTHIITILFVLLIIISFVLFFFEIPSPSKIVKESYKLEIK